MGTDGVPSCGGVPGGSGSALAGQVPTGGSEDFGEGVRAHGLWVGRLGAVNHYSCGVSAIMLWQHLLIIHRSTGICLFYSTYPVVSSRFKGAV